MNEQIRAEFEQWMQQNRRYQFVGKEFVHTDDLRAFFARYAGDCAKYRGYKSTAQGVKNDRQ